jgi:glycosyltransferase involved in cell wall biosynthesis/GT2 family glycosyltransferase
MIDIAHPDFSNTPANPARPCYAYAPRAAGEPLVSIITPYYNAGPEFDETVRCVRGMSLAHWEWLLVDDGSTDRESLARLGRLACAESRVRVLRQANAGPGVARNRAVEAARAPYLLQLDCDDLVEPSFAEKALWLLATQPQFAACNSYNVTFGQRNLLWPHGFEREREFLGENWTPNIAVIRREAWRAAGGYDPRVSFDHADWDFWLKLAEAGLWGYTIGEYLTWYRAQRDSLLLQIERDRVRTQAFYARLQAEHARLRSYFPRPHFDRSTPRSLPRAEEGCPVRNPLAKPAGTTRVLWLVPWLEVGGADKFSLDCMRALAGRGYEFTVAATRQARHAWLSEFARLTPDIFCLHQFLDYADYPRFLNYLIASRQIDALVISNSELGYGLLPYLRARHPRLPLLDYNHLEEDGWANGGYPALSVDAGCQEGTNGRSDPLDLRLTSTERLKRWMVARGAEASRIRVCHTNIDVTEWIPARHDTAAVRRAWGVPVDAPLVLFIGRLVEQKRPLLAGRILKALAAREPSVVALVVGDGPERGRLQAFVARHGLAGRVRLLGALPSEQTCGLLAAADLLLLPSAREGLALVLFESLAMETVPVAADVGGNAELVTPDCGVLILPGASEAEEIAAYAAALEGLIRDPERRRAMAACGRRRVDTHFDLERLADAMDAALGAARVLAAKRPCIVATVELEAARAAAQAAVDAARRFEAPELLNSGAGFVAIMTPAQLMRMGRRLRYRLLPIGSERYEVYKRLRHRLRDAAGALTHLTRRG